MRHELYVALALPHFHVVVLFFFLGSWKKGYVKNGAQVHDVLSFVMTT